MGIAERKRIEKEELQRKILDAAGTILIEEGYRSLSIRKIAARIEYSPGLIYHYFKDKAAIVTALVEQGYGRILQAIGTVLADPADPVGTIRRTLIRYIELVLESPLEYRAILLNDIEEVREKVGILDRGISKRRKSMELLGGIIARAVQEAQFRPVEPELAAQIIWTSTYGLLARLLLEPEIPPEQRERLLNQHLDILFYGLVARERVETK